MKINQSQSFSEKCFQKINWRKLSELRKSNFFWKDFDSAFKIFKMKCKWIFFWRKKSFKIEPSNQGFWKKILRLFFSPCSSCVTRIIAKKKKMLCKSILKMKIFSQNTHTHLLNPLPNQLRKTNKTVMIIFNGGGEND